MVLKYKSMLFQLFWIQMLFFSLTGKVKKYMSFNLLQPEKNLKKYGLDDSFASKTQKTWI